MALSILSSKKAEDPKPGVMSMRVLAITAIVLVILIALLFKSAGIFWKLTNRSVCSWEFLTKSMTNEISLGYSASNPDCQLKTITITLDSLEKEKSNAKSRIKEHKKIYVKPIPFNEDSEQELLEFVLYSQIANEMKLAWDDVWRGNLPFLDQWWLFYPCHEQLGCEAKDEAIKRVLGVGPGGVIGAAALIKIGLSPLKAIAALELIKASKEVLDAENMKARPCITRAQIVFDQSVKSKFGQRQFTRLYDWMEMSIVPKDLKKRNYIDYLGKSVISKDIKSNEIGNFNMDKTYIILYKRDNSNLIVRGIVSALRGIIPDSTIDDALSDLNNVFLEERDYLYLTEFKNENLKNSIGCTTLIA